MGLSYFTSDETIIEMLPKRRHFVCLPRQKRSRQNFAGQNAKFGRKNMMFWGFIKEPGERKLIEVENRVNSSI